uniref:Uncharacterized protein n=1 Tax=Hippocampus comes TaxID=109280 RepID=A0A3Q2Z430_HIPCM
MQLYLWCHCMYTICIHPILCTAMMQEFTLSNLQRKQISDCLKGDLEKEKKRLQNILATGQEEEYTASQNVAGNRKPEVTEETDRYQEVLDEIQERRQFLADMASLGQERQYIHIMNTEISQVNNSVLKSTSTSLVGGT